MAKKSSANSSSPSPSPDPSVVQAQWGQLEFDLQASAAASPAPITPPAVPAPAPAKKLRRSRVPDNLASQYGENTGRRAAQPAPEPEAPRKRRTAAERQQRRELMTPDEGLVRRLQRINDMPLKTVKRQPVPRGSWRFSCGRCGNTTDFAVPAAVCPHCGAIALKE